ncbi:MAG TPA: serine/threonine-protein kinase, partial [Candidatus Melainabacteria bacterium]|nr:serine/threonine-protein kinase [Candidatus Melainabacteria bacterium]
EKQLAFGGLSAIYLVQKEKKDLYILKEAVVPDDVDEDNRRIAEEYLMRESKMLFSLSHPHIASVVDYFVEEGRTYLLLNYVHGQDLRQLIAQNGVQKESIVIDWVRQLAEAIAYLHSQDPPVIHRDITPDNMVLRENGDVIIIDFGAANEFVGTATGTLIGKQAYIAPEQLRGKACPQSDLYALGGTAFYLLTGRDPVPLSQPDLLKVLPDSNPQLAQLLKDLTAFEKDDRIESAEAVIERLNELLALKSVEK